MFLLALDTTTKSCSVAIVTSAGLLAEVTTARNETHARHLMTMVDQALTLAGISIDAVDGFAVTRGPGSFTGLRIGLSAVKGLAMAGDKPVVPVSSLEALAVQAVSASGGSGTIVSMIDAYRGEVFLAGYRPDGDRMTPVIPETVVAPETAARQVTDLAGSVTLVGSGFVTYLSHFTQITGARIGSAPEMAHMLRAATVGRMGLGRLDTDGRKAVDIMPVYLRKSDAQIHQARRTG